MKISKRLPIYVFIPLFVTAIMLYIVQSKKQTPPPEINGIYLTHPEKVMPFVLTQSNSKVFSDQNLTGQWSLVFFGFTYCPDICPTTMGMLNAVTHSLQETHPTLPEPQVVFVSIDPERDNLAQLDKYSHYFNPKFIAVTGEQSQLKAFSRQLGVVFDKVEVDPKRPDEYMMEHSTSIALINPQGGIQAIFTAPHQVDALTSDLALVMSR